MMTCLGHITEWATDGLIGKDALLGKKLDAACIDMRMPGIDGMAHFKWAKQGRGIPCLRYAGCEILGCCAHHGVLCFAQSLPAWLNTPARQLRPKCCTGQLHLPSA